MDTFLASMIPWQLKAAAFLAIGLPIALVMLFLPKSWLARAAEDVPTLDPNGITLWGIVLFVLGEVFLLAHFYLLGWILVVVGGMCDVLDGRSAKAVDEFGVYRSERSRWWGSILDPTADKIKYLPPIGYAFLFHVSGWVIWPMIAMDIFGTIMRFIDGTVREATFAGKFKATLQVGGMLVCGPIFFRWTTDLRVAHLVLGIATIASALSVVSRLKRWSWIEAFTKRFFSHQDIS